MVAVQPLTHAEESSRTVRLRLYRARATKKTFLWLLLLPNRIPGLVEISPFFGTSAG